MKKSIPFFILLVSLCTTVKSQWQQTNGPQGVYVNCLAEIGGNILVGTTASGIFKSTDNGNSWTISNSGIPNPVSAYSMVTDGINIFCGTNSGIYVSPDNGNSWTAVNTSLQGVWIMAIQGNNIYAVSGSSNIYMSANYGVSWTPINSGFPSNPNFNSLAVNGTDVYAGLVYWNGSNNISALYHSSNNGGSWSEMLNGTQHIGVQGVAFINGNIWVGAISQGVLFSSDSGATWTTLNAGLPQYPAIYYFGQIGTDIFAAGYNGVFRSIDNGATWVTVNLGLLDLHILELLIKGTDIFIGTGSGIFVTHNNGNTWMETNNNIICSWVPAMGVSGTDIFCGTAYSGVHLSIDNGNTWTHLSNGIPSTLSVNTILVRNSKIFAGGNGGVFVSNNNGNTWNSSLSSGATCLVANSSRIFAGRFGSVAYSDDEGLTWISVSTGLPSAGPQSMAVNGSNVFVGILHNNLAPGGIYRSTNNGLSWTAANNGFPSTANIKAIFIDGNRILAAATCVTGSGLFLSTNNGNSWTLLNPIWIESSIIKYGTVLYAAANGGVCASADDGATWVPVNTGLPSIAIYSVAVCGNNLLAGTFNNGVWTRPLNQITVGLSEAVNNNYALNIYPNPVASSSIISFYPESNMADPQIQIFDMMGKEVTQLELQIPNTNLEKGNMKSGIYFYQVTSEGKQIAAGKFAVE